jgi:RNA polymerase sigma-70 factor (ECF subfamily)
MFEDKWLSWKLKQGSNDALCKIYTKYKADMLALAIALSNDKNLSEDIVHDCFVSFASCGRKLELKTSLESYLLTSVANRVRNIGRDKIKSAADISEIEIADSEYNQPQKQIMNSERIRKINDAMNQLPYEQQEIIILHLQSGLKFKEIADSQNVSINTIQSRYRYGIDKLRSLLEDEV